MYRLTVNAVDDPETQSHRPVPIRSPRDAGSRHLRVFRFGVFIFDDLGIRGRTVSLMASSAVIVSLGYLFSLFQHCGFVPGQGNALIELAFDLPIELPHGPAGQKRFGFVERSCLGPVHGQQANVGISSGLRAFGSFGAIQSDGLRSASVLPQIVNTTSLAFISQRRLQPRALS